ncbi:MAG: DUF3644 domain-containing protein, partial [Proteobacteria bacterium]|nr:DUF3644 domain-containing protein [Pseudomonadota bacterium]
MAILLGLKNLFSLNIILSEIEIYNKPDFKDRKQIFSILIVAAWESLFKTKILKDNKNHLTALYVKKGRRFERGRRTGVIFTIGIEEAMRRCAVRDVVMENTQRLINNLNAGSLPVKCWGAQKWTKFLGYSVRGLR